MSGPAARVARALVPAIAFAGLGVTLAARAELPQDALGWLQRAASAARNTSYSGTFVHTNGERTSTMRITHVFVNGEERERIEPLDGPPHEIVRRNEEMYCYFPDAKTVRLDRRVNGRFFPAVFQGPPEALAENYELKLGKVERLLGHECQWVRLEPKDLLRYAQRLCAELASGLVIRAKTLNERRQVIEQYTFTDLKLGPHVARSDANSVFQPRTKQWTTDAAPREEAKGVDTGWTISAAPPGFRKVTEMRRTLPGRPQPVSQIILSDGFANVSVFVEAARQPSRTEEAASQDGSNSVFVRPLGENLVTVLGEVPPATAEQVGRSVARRP